MGDDGRARLACEALLELEKEPRLADTGLADEPDHLAARPDHGLEATFEQLELVTPSDECGEPSTDPDAEARALRAAEAKRGLWTAHAHEVEAPIEERRRRLTRDDGAQRR